VRCSLVAATAGTSCCCAATGTSCCNTAARSSAAIRPRRALAGPNCRAMGCAVGLVPFGNLQAERGKGKAVTPTPHCSNRRPPRGAFMVDAGWAPPQPLPSRACWWSSRRMTGPMDQGRQEQTPWWVLPRRRVRAPTPGRCFKCSATDQWLPPVADSWADFPSNFISWAGFAVY
jgi:hypothetical protein